MSKLADRLGLKIGTRDILLPSNGKFGGPDKVTVRPFLTKDEKYISAIDEQTGEKQLQLLSKAVVIDPADFDLKNLTDADALYILLVSRCLTYGDIVTVRHGCTSCGKIGEKDIQLFDHDMKLLKKTTFKIKLPVSKLTIHYKFLSISDKEKIVKKANEKYNILNLNIDEDEMETRIVSSMITKILGPDGEDHLTGVEKFELVNSLLTKKDMDKWSEKIDEDGVNPKFTFKSTCAKCDHKGEYEMVLNPNFFFSSASKMGSLSLT